DLHCVDGRNERKSENCAIGLRARWQAIEFERVSTDGGSIARSRKDQLWQRQCPIGRWSLDQEINRHPLRRRDIGHDALTFRASCPIHGADAKHGGGLAERNAPRNPSFGGSQRSFVSASASGTRQPEC